MKAFYSPFNDDDDDDYDDVDDDDDVDDVGDDAVTQLEKTRRRDPRLCWPSGEKQQLTTHAVWPESVRSAAPSLARHSLIYCLIR